MTTPKPFEQVSPVRLYQRIVEQVEDAIARGDLQPGGRLPSERELVVQFGTSRPTVREALRVLESNGVVRSRPGDPNGPEILPFSPVALQKQLTRMLSTTGLNSASLLSFRMILDGCGSLLAAQLRTETEVQEMERCIDDMARAMDGDFEAFGEADIAFHDAVALASRNTLLPLCNYAVRTVVVSLISDKVANSHNSKALMRQSLDHHREVLEAIKEGDGAAASRISCRNLYDYYHEYVAEADRPAIAAMLHPDDRAERLA
jgi:GntR family transcriptional repressor for pyruvate dehydrogenase complex